MKVLIQSAQGANYFIRLSWMHAFQRLGYNVIIWNPQTKSAHDVFAEYKPDIFIGDTYQVDRAIIKNLIKYKNIKSILWGSQWGPHDAEVDTERFPLLFTNDKEKKNIEILAKETSLKYVFNYYTQKYAEYTHGYWKNVGVEPVGLPLSADIDLYPFTKAEEKYRADVVFCGNYWPYKSRTIGPYLFPLIYANLNVKIFGYGWSTPNNLGRATDETIRKFYASSVVCPNFYEEHSLVWGYDLNQRLFQTAAAGGFQISQLAKSAKEDIFTDDEIIFVDNATDFIAQCLYYIANPEQRIPYIKKSVNTVYKYHQHLHRVSQLLEWLGFPEEAQRALDQAEENYQAILPEIEAL